jgi:hypothetical protein
MAHFILPLLQDSSTTPSFHTYYVLFPFQYFCFFFPSTCFFLHHLILVCCCVLMCVRAYMHKYMKEFFRILSFFLKRLLCHSFWFHLHILFPKNKSSPFSISVFSCCLFFLCECMISKCLLFLNLCFQPVIFVE